MKSTNAKEKVKTRFVQQNQSKFQKVRKPKKIVRNWAANIVKVSEQQDSEVTENGEILTANC